MCGYYILQRIKELLDIGFEIRLITVILKVKNPQVFAIVTLRWWGEGRIYSEILWTKSFTNILGISNDWHSQTSERMRKSLQ